MTGATSSLSRRLTRLRVTALPTALDTTKPHTLGEDSSGRRRAYRTKFRRPLRTPERVVAENCREVLIRCCCASTSRLLLRGPVWRLASKSPTEASDQKRSPRRGSQLRRNRSAALGAAVCQDGTTGAGAHTKTEAVLLGTTAVIRLKSPLAHCNNSKDCRYGPTLLWVRADRILIRNRRWALSVLPRGRTPKP